MTRPSTIAATLFLATLAACAPGADQDDGGGWGDGSGDDVGDGGGDGSGDGGGDGSGDGGGDGSGDDGGDGPAPVETVPASSYAIATDLAIPADALLPQTGYDAIQRLRALRANPGATLLDALADAGVPLLDDLPSVIESRLAGWLSSAINAHVDLSVLDPVIAALDTVIADVDVDGELVLSGDTAVHRVVALRFVVAGESVTVAADAIDLGGAVVTEAAVTVTVAGETVTLGEHAFGIPFGEYAWTAVNQVLIAKTGGDVRAALGAAVDCAAVAAQVSAMGIYGYTVGHEAELAALCNTGLDLIEEELHAKFSAYDWDALTLGGGTATMVDADADGLAEQLANGTWATAIIDVGQGPRFVTGTFTASMQ